MQQTNRPSKQPQRLKTSIGGQAIIEGVMMRASTVSALAVRKPDGEIHVETKALPAHKPWYKRCPVVRGIFNFVDTLRFGYQCLMRSADLAGFEDDPSPFEQKLIGWLGDRVSSVFSVVATVLGLGLAVGLFLVLPTLVVGWLRPVLPQGYLAAAEGGMKIALFLAYLALVARMAEIRRVFEYHGAEHKTIACYEAGLPLTVANVRPQSRFHPRCGTSFLLIVMVVSILVFSTLSWENVWLRIGLKLLLLPVVVGLSYEVIKLAGRYDNPLTRAVSAPGLWLQRITTREPDDSQIEVAIAAMAPCVPDDPETEKW